MASGYIGKISAVVTANTADLSKKLRSSTQEWNSYGASLNRSLQKTAAGATSSIERILTPLQRLEKQLKAATSSPLNIRTEDQANQIRRLTSAALQINQPLEAAAGSFQKLSSEVQSGFAPALGRAQNQAQALFKILEVGRAPAEKYFEVVQNRVDRTTQALQRLTQAQQIASRGFTGNELQFANPAVFESLNRSATLSRQAGGLSADALSGGDIGSRVSKLNSLSQSISAAFSRLESIRISPDVDTSDVQRAERELASLLSTARSVQDGLQSAIQVQGNIGASTAFMSTRDPSGRPLQERFALQQAIKNSRELERQVVEEIRDAEAKAAVQASARLELANKRLNVLQQESNLQSFQGASTNVRDRLAQIERVRQQTEAPRGIRQLQRELDERSVRGYAAQVEVLKSAISGLSSQAAAPAVATLQRLRQAIDDAMRNGTIRTEQTSAAIRDLVVDATRASAAVAGVDTKSLGRSVARAGDVGRRGFDKFSLALNQAAFAVDDFFSATGGLEFKIRAVQNNLTQLGFILDGTRGLFLALGAAIGGQVVLATLKYFDAIEDTSAKAEALNGILQEQQNAADSLAASYRNLGDSIRDAGLDEIGRTRQARERQFADILNQERQTRRDIRASIDPEVIQIRTRQAEINQRLQESPNVGERAGLQAELLTLRTRLAAAEERAGRTAASGQSPFKVLLEAARARAQSEAEALQRTTAVPLDVGAVARAEFGVREKRIRQLDLSSTSAARDAINAEIADLARRIEKESGFFGDPLLVRELEDQIQNLLAELADITDTEASDAFIDLTRSIFGLSDGLDEVLKELNSAGISGGSIARQLENINALQNQLLDRAQAAREQGDVALIEGIQLSLEGLDEWREELLESARIVGERARRSAEALREFEDAASRGDSVREGLRTQEERLSQQVSDIFASFERDVINSSGRPEDIEAIRAAQNEAFARFAQRQLAGLTPALQALADASTNAVLQGPSRARLNASDVTTQAGTDELNRLLRGDDSARNQNLVELRKQTQQLEEANRTLRNLGVAQ